MPHIEITHFPKILSEEEKTSLADAITQVVCKHLGTPVGAVSIALETITPEQWRAQIIEPRLLPAWHRLIKTPDYEL